MGKIKSIKITISFLIVFFDLFLINNTLFANGVAWITNPANNHDYAVIDATDWDSAELIAQSFGGHLVTINDQSENTWLLETFGDYTDDPRYWIGFNDKKQEGTWVWSSGETPIFQNWCDFEPNDCCTDVDGEENAAVMNDVCYGWNDLPDWHHHYAIIEVVLNIEAIIDIDPDTVNLKSKGKYITCHIELPEGYDTENIDIQTVKLKTNGAELSAELFPTRFNDYNRNNIIDLMVKFDRQDFYTIVNVPVAEIMVTGDLMTGNSFEGTDTVLVIDKGNHHRSKDHGSVVY